MSAEGFLTFYVCVLAVILACRCLPLLLLKGRGLSPRVNDAIGLIPPAAYAALVANDLFDPAAGLSVPGLVAGAFVVAVAVRTRSLVVCAVVGMAAYAALTLL